ncbi:DNA polymerase III subunit alpha [Mycoplasma nasistruthionis]|uniref:DNA-directed DNA polymerase n=1 Tax=Mycoplasma nasistruthionis TaxID=353852 RepID=A0A5B7XXI4_9MOLU|nr:DNA polymerase III subunit alpha [Mycoplasma nasistruthionis]QCZ36633.1 DNA polymerase III subunit alpha [Mycoplasma nasistruthionis]
MNKIYLHTNTEYSFFNSTIRVEELIKLAVENKLEYLALTDFENLFALPFYFKMQKKYGIKPIIGAEISLKEDFVVMVYAKNNSGYVKLNQLIFKKSQNQQVSYYDLNDPDLIVIDHLDLGHRAKDISLEQYWPNFYLNNKQKLNHQTTYAPTKKVLNFEQNEILQILQKMGNKQQNFKLYDDYLFDEDFTDLDPEVAENIQKIAQSCNVQAPDSSLKLAKSELGDSKEVLFSLFDEKKLNDLALKFGKSAIENRINYETNVIEKLGYINYFLIIQDVISFAKSQNIEVGPGRGSASGSIIAYLLGITEVDPIQFGLLFERFLNIDRVSLPDIDIDIQDDRREEILEYIKNKYGAENVALITTFQTLGAKNSIRDIARYLNIPVSEVDKICNAIDVDQTLQEAYEKSKVYKKLVDMHPNLHEYASQIQGLPRQIGVHPAGIIIANQPIIDVVPVYQNNNFQQVQFTLNDIEQYGLLKIDFLGLKNLTIIKQIENLIPLENHFENSLAVNYAKFLDVKTQQLLNNLLTNGIFQIESKGMKESIQKVNIDSFDDIYAIISLFRPGPYKYISEYADVKQHKKAMTKVHPLYDEIVAPTFGVIVYQEQIMQIAQKVALMPFSQADLLRRAISKKNEQDLKAYESIFFDGGLKNGLNQETLQVIYDNILYFGKYGFNKSHAVAYALISYKMAYYKAHFPLQFYKVLITNSASDQHNIRQYVEDAIKQKIKVFSPDINGSSDVVISIDDSLFLSLLMIKSVGTAACLKIVNERNLNGAYTDFISCYLRLIINAKISESLVETLIKANALRRFGNISTLLKSLPIAKQYADYFKTKYKKLKAIRIIY